MSIFKYYTKRFLNSNCYILEFNPNIIRFDVSVNTPNKLEKLSIMNGDPKSTERTIAKLNGGFFAMNGKKEYIGTFVDEGKVHNNVAPYYPSVILWKDNTLGIEFDVTNERLDYYAKNAHWAIGSPWSILINGKYDYHYSKETLIEQFSHPFTLQPRTLLGQKKDGTIVWVVIDGRKINSVGMTVESCSKLMLNLGCYNAVNLDGGGSSEMICYDNIKNSPCTGVERAIGNAMFAYIDFSKAYEGNTIARLNLRKTPVSNGEVIKLIDKHSTVKIIDYSKGYYNVVCDEVTGWCSAYYVELKGEWKDPVKEISFNELIKLGYGEIKL